MLPLFDKKNYVIKNKGLFEATNMKNDIKIIYISLKLFINILQPSDQGLKKI